MKIGFKYVPGCISGNFQHIRRPIILNLIEDNQLAIRVNRDPLFLHRSHNQSTIQPRLSVVDYAPLRCFGINPNHMVYIAAALGVINPVSGVTFCAVQSHLTNPIRRNGNNMNQTAPMTTNATMQNNNPRQPASVTNAASKKSLFKLLSAGPL